MKKNIFTACLCVFLLNSITYLRAQTYESLSSEGVDIFGALCHSDTWGPGVYWPDSAGIYKFKSDRGVMRTPVVVPIPLEGGCTYHNGKAYVNEFDIDTPLHKCKPKWKIYDAYSWELEKETELPDNNYGTTFSLSYDATTSFIYALDNMLCPTGLVKVTPETGEMVKIATLSVDLYAIACDSYGNLYGVTRKKELCRINKQNGDVKIIGPIKMDGGIEQGVLVEDGVSTIMTYGKISLLFNNQTGKLYWIYDSWRALPPGYYGAYFTAFAEINIATAKATLIDAIPQGSFVSGAFFREPKFGAPAAIADFEFVPNTVGSVTGKLRFRTPDKSYDGKTLNGDISICIMEKEKVLSTMNGLKPGTVYETATFTFSQDKHDVSILSSNETGRGLEVVRSFYAGYDIPSSPKNVILTADGLTTTVAWDAPTTGFYGGTINPLELNYMVYRYPGETVVASGLTERSFTETHPEEMTRYTYRIVSYAGERKGANRLSNYLIVGTPLVPPYTGFSDIFGLYDYYTIVDNNKDSFTWWYYDQGIVAYSHNETAAADDWLISPAFSLTPGEYKLAFDSWSYDMEYPESMKVYFGTSVNVADMTRMLIDLPTVPYESTTYELPVTVTKDGLYHFGFYAYSPAFQYNLYLTNVSFIKTEDGGGIFNSEKEPGIDIFVKKEGIEIYNPSFRNIKVYGVDGHQVYTSSNANIAIDLNPGIYLVSTNGEIQKVLVK